MKLYVQFLVFTYTTLNISLPQQDAIAFARCRTMQSILFISLEMIHCTNQSHPQLPRHLNFEPALA